MQTGQNSIASENSLPQPGQVRWGSVLMGLTALQPHSEPKATPRSTESCEIGPHGPWQTLVPFHKQLRVHLIVARQIRFRNKIPTVGVLRRSVFMTTFGDGRFETTFEVPVNRALSQTLAVGLL